MEKRFGVVSADGHCRLMHLPFDLWTKRLPKKFQDDGPRIVQGADGARQWIVEGRPWSGVGWAGWAGGRSIAIRGRDCRKARARHLPRGECQVSLRGYGPDGWMPSSLTAPTTNIGDQGSRIARRLRSGGQRLGARALPGVQRPVHHASPAALPDTRGGGGRTDAGGGVRPADRSDLRLGQRARASDPPDVGAGRAAAAETGMPVNLHANPSGGSRQMGVGVAGIEPRNQALMRVANFPMGLMAELMSAVVFSGICDRHPGLRFVLEEAGVGWFRFLFWRFDREYDFGGPESRVFKPDIQLFDKPHRICQTPGVLYVRGRGGGRFSRVPEVGIDNFLWASDFPGVDSPWPHPMGHASAEAALGKEALDQLVFENAVSLYKIPVSLNAGLAPGWVTPLPRIGG